MLARHWTVVCTQETSSTAAFTVHSHNKQTLSISGLHQLIHTQIQILITLNYSSDGALFFCWGGGGGPMRLQARGGWPNTAARLAGWRRV
jgi:hypothetical protein